MKTCTKCLEIKELHAFSKSSSGTKDGLNSWCKICVQKKTNEITHARIVNDPDYRHKLNAQTGASIKERYANDIIFRSKKIHRAMLRNRNLEVQFNTLSLTEQEAVLNFYINCPKGYHVDHIYPYSRGGLHCLSNLQYLPAHDNHVKSSEIPPNTDIDGTKILWG